MIIVAIVALSAVVLTALVASFGSGLPTMPADIVAVINDILNLLADGAGVLWAYCHPQIVKPLLALLVTAYGVYQGYRLVMWLATKIPMLGVSD